VSDSTLDQIGVAAVIIVGFTFVALAIWGILHMAKRELRQAVNSSEITLS